METNDGTIWQGEVPGQVLDLRVEQTAEHYANVYTHIHYCFLGENLLEVYISI